MFKTNNILILQYMIVSIIRLIHFGIILAICASVFVPNIQFKKIILTLLILLLFQYVSGWDQCGLTVLEGMVLGEANRKDGFIYRTVKPIITVSEAWVDSYLYVIHILLILILAIQIKNSS